MKALKKLSVLAFYLVSNLVVSQDTMYVVQNDLLVGEHAVSNIDSLIFYNPNQIDTIASSQVGDGLTDIDGNTYESVVLGNQEWMAENLRTSKYADGTLIPNITEKYSWRGLDSAAWCHYDNDSQYDSIYGKIYNWYSVETDKLCPTGWHVPSYDEWTVLTDYLSANGHKMKEGAALKSKSQWDGTDNYGWKALPGGSRSWNGNYGSDGRLGYWWSSSENTPTKAWIRYLLESDTLVASYKMSKGYGFSVRCLRDDESKTNTVKLPTLTTFSLSDITKSSAVSGGNITNDGGSTILTRGVAWSKSSNPNVSGSATTNGIGTGSFTSILTELSASTTYYVRAYATHRLGTAYGNVVTFTTPPAGVEYGSGATDFDGNTYKSVIIGDQEWMAENLRTTKYTDGTSIPNVTGYQWGNLDSAAWCYYDDDSKYDSIYGKLYNWYAVETGKLCPTGWHVSTSSEWNNLIDYLDENGHHGAKVKALKSKSGWVDHYGESGNGTDDFEFNALPGGCRYLYGFRDIGEDGDWWAYSETNIFWTKHFSASTDNNISSSRSGDTYAQSVRCLKD